MAELLPGAVVCRFAYVSLLLPAVFGSFVLPLCVLCLQCCIGWRVSFVAEIVPDVKGPCVFLNSSFIFYFFYTLFSLW